MSKITVPPFDPLTWKQADVDVHVATRDGEFAGFVEFDGVAHLVRDAQGAELGSFSDLDAARRALETSHESHSKARGSVLPAVFRRRPRRARA
ncbi:hypothetical protein [Microbacterium sp. 179-I 3D4 NHS]|uniref:hypothetical protein n=1 Tax=Microbacterium sp. 179-I 3D4 NHS TaxID=3142381 RepID=UPI0039A1E941